MGSFRIPDGKTAVAATWEVAALRGWMLRHRQLAEAPEKWAEAEATEEAVKGFLLEWERV